MTPAMVERAAALARQIDALSKLVDAESLQGLSEWQARWVFGLKADYASELSDILDRAGKIA